MEGGMGSSGAAIEVAGNGFSSSLSLAYGVRREQMGALFFPPLILNPRLLVVFTSPPFSSSNQQQHQFTIFL
jgi:hypothetical protein